MATFGTVYWGVVQYYLLAGDVFRLHRLQWVMETAMLKTLAAKHCSSVSKMAAKHKARIETPNGPRVCFEARIERKNRKPLVARFGGVPSNGSERRNPPIVSRSGWTIRRRNPSRDSWRIPARSAEARATCKCTMSGSRRPRTRRMAAFRLGAFHAPPAPQNGRGLRHLPRPHPFEKAGQTTHAVVTGAG
ncbi:group II intron reverse transcriptase/maturase [Streptomyces sp. NPDC056930]|uniref:group II intron reverse transcriptase/maturase n=1 Tax=Streptomyces sp. NPDC056930 TaxID=3345967 RepID=UPI003636CADB